MNRMQQHLNSWQRDEVETLNLLQNRGLISDRAVTAADVADEDAAKAVGWLLLMSNYYSKPINPYQK